MDELRVGVGFCTKCKEDVPVARIEIPVELLEDSDKKFANGNFNAIFCPVCDTLLNAKDDIKLTYYSLEDLEKVTSWRGEINE